MLVVDIVLFGIGNSIVKSVMQDMLNIAFPQLFTFLTSQHHNICLDDEGSHRFSTSCVHFKKTNNFM